MPVKDIIERLQKLNPKQDLFWMDPPNDHCSLVEAQVIFIDNEDTAIKYYVDYYVEFNPLNDTLK